MDLTPVSGILRGSFTSTGAGFNLPMGFIPDYYHALNITQASSVANPAVVKKVEWFRGMAASSAILVKNTAGLATDETSIIVANGITAYDAANPIIYAPVALTSLTRGATTAVLAAAPHGLVTGDLARIYGVATLSQLNGLVFQVTYTGATTFTIPVDSSGFAAGGTAGFVQKVSPSLFSPYNNEIVGITQAANAVVSTARPHGYQIGDYVRLRIPTQFGMIQANNKQVYINAVGSAVTFTCDLDTTAFTAFAFPLIAAYPLTFAQVSPVGEIAYSIFDPMRNIGTFGLNLGAGVVGAAADVWYWYALKGSAI
jgi:hypothetical protein